MLVLGEADIEAILKDDDNLWVSLARIESKIEELLILKDSPEKDRKAEYAAMLQE